jgi:hypothetical protein
MDGCIPSCIHRSYSLIHGFDHHPSCHVTPESPGCIVCMDGCIQSCIHRSCSLIHGFDHHPSCQVTPESPGCIGCMDGCNQSCIHRSCSLVHALIRLWIPECIHPSRHRFPLHVPAFLQCLFVVLVIQVRRIESPYTARLEASSSRCIYLNQKYANHSGSCPYSVELSYRQVT